MAVKCSFDTDVYMYIFILVVFVMQAIYVRAFSFQMKNFLKQIRSSASKKKVEKLFVEKVEKEQSDLVAADSGICTQRSQYSDDTMTSYGPKSTRLVLLNC